MIVQRSIDDIIEPYFLLAYRCGSAITWLIGIAASTVIRRTPANNNAILEP